MPHQQQMTNSFELGGGSYVDGSLSCVTNSHNCYDVVLLPCVTTLCYKLTHLLRPRNSGVKASLQFATHAAPNLLRTQHLLTSQHVLISSFAVFKVARLKYMTIYCIIDVSFWEGADMIYLVRWFKVHLNLVCIGTEWNLNVTFPFTFQFHEIATIF